MKNTKQFVIIVGGGNGSRFGSKIPKQFLCLNNKPILFYSVEAFYNFNNNIKIIIVLPKEYTEYWKRLCAKYKFKIQHIVTEGGETRFYSVKNGLKLVEDKSIVAIHDAVRPLISKKLITDCFNNAAKLGNAVPATSVTDTIRELNRNKSKLLVRNNIKLIQTPQVFQSDALIKAYKHKYNKTFTDDASVVEADGNKLFFVEGEKQNIKITTSEDLKIAECYNKLFR